MDHAKDVDALEQRIKELCYAERYRDAESILRELLDRLREVTLPDEKRIMRTLHNLACVLFQQSKLVSVPAGNDSALDSAAAVLRTLLQMQVSLLGPGHEDVLETKSYLDEVQRTFDELPDMPLEEAEATAEATSDDAAAVREGCGGDERTAESLPTETLRDPSFAATVEAVHRQLSSNPTEEEFEGAKVRLSEALRTFFEWPDKQETQNRASFHMEELYALQRRLRRKVGGVMGRPARIDDRFGRHLFFNERTARFEPVPAGVTRYLRGHDHVDFLGLDAHGKPIYINHEQVVHHGRRPAVRRAAAHSRARPYADPESCSSLPEVGDRHFGEFWKHTEETPTMGKRPKRGDHSGGSYGHRDASSKGDGATFNGNNSGRTCEETATHARRNVTDLSHMAIDDLPTPITLDPRAHVQTLQEALEKSDKGQQVVFKNVQPPVLRARLASRSVRKKGFGKNQHLYAQYDSDTDLAEECAKMSLPPSGSKTQTRQPTEEQEDEKAAEDGPMVFTSTVCAQMVLASMTSGNRCDTCDKVLEDESDKCLQYEVPYYTFCSQSCIDRCCDIPMANKAHAPGMLPPKPAIIVKATTDCPKCSISAGVTYELLQRADKAMCTYGPVEVQLRDVKTYCRVCKCGAHSLPSVLDFASKGFFPWICHTDGTQLLWGKGSFVWIEKKLLQRYYQARFELHVSVSAQLRSEHAHTSDKSVSLSISSNVTAMNAALAQYGIGKAVVENMMLHPRATCLVCNKTGQRCMFMDGSEAITNFALAKHSAENCAATTLQPPHSILLGMQMVKEGIEKDDNVRKGAKLCKSPCHTLHFKANKHLSQGRGGIQNNKVKKSLFLSLCPHRIVPINGALFSEVHECHALFRLLLRCVVAHESFRFFEFGGKKFLGVGYDVVCVVEPNLWQIAKEVFGDNPKLANLQEFTKLFIGGFHEHMHKLHCRHTRSQYAVPGTGLDLADNPESYFHNLRQDHNNFSKMGAMFMPSAEVLLHEMNRRQQMGSPKQLQDALCLADKTLSKHVQILADIRNCFEKYRPRGCTLAFRVQVDKWAKGLTAITSQKDVETKEQIGWMKEHTLAEAQLRFAALNRYLKSKEMDDLLLTLPIGTNGVAKLPKDGEKLKHKILVLQNEVTRSLHHAERAVRADLEQMAEYDDYDSDLDEFSWETVDPSRLQAFASAAMDEARKKLPSLQLQRLQAALLHHSAMFHACRDIVDKRDLNTKASAGHCTAYKTKVMGQIAGLVEVYNAWLRAHASAPTAGREMKVEDCLTEAVSQAALAGRAGLMDADDAPFPLQLQAVRSKNKTERAKEARAFKINEVCALHTELLERIDELTIASKPLPAEIAGADSRLRWGWRRALLDEGERLKCILKEWKGRFGEDAAFRIEAAAINKRNAILDDSEVSD